MKDNNKTILENTNTPISIKTTATIIATFFVVLVSLSFFLPWQQTSFGSGRVIAYDQTERQQFIDAPIKGRVIKWFIREGQAVSVGDKILEIRDNDPEYLGRMEAQRDAIQERFHAVKEKISSANNVVNSLRDSKLNIKNAFDSKINNAKQKIEVAKENINSSEAGIKVAAVNLDRYQMLFKEGLTSKRKLELAELKFTKLKIELIKNKKKLLSARANLSQSMSEKQKELATIDAKVASAIGKSAVAKSDLTKVKESLPKINASISRQNAQIVFAPKAGTVMRLMVQEGSGQVKIGDPLVTLIPNTISRAVELWVNNNDIPLIHDKQEVRLQFQGYPAIQLSGWPELAVGTFSGIVDFIDNTDQGGQKFRIMIRPDKNSLPWPDAKYLRQGVRCKGWIFLNRVSIAFELWRKFNDFPPALPDMKKPKGKKK